MTSNPKQKIRSTPTRQLMYWNRATLAYQKRAAEDLRRCPTAGAMLTHRHEMLYKRYEHLHNLDGLTYRQRHSLRVIEARPLAFLSVGRLVRIVRIKNTAKTRELGFAGRLYVHGSEGNTTTWLEVRHTGHIRRAPWHKRPARYAWEVLHEYDKPAPKTPAVPANIPAPDPAAVKAYQEREAARKARLEARATNARNEANGRFQAAHNAVKYIPPGQPILVGHHSERGHRAALKRHDNHMRKGIEASDKAKELERRAANFERNQKRAIKSHDPEAAVKLRAKIASLEEWQETMKQANKIIRANKEKDVMELRALLVAAGVPEKIMDGYGSPLNSGYGKRYPGFTYSVKNNGAKIRDAKKRLSAILEQQARPEASEDVGNVEVSESAEWNSVQIAFPGKPSEAIRADMKRYGWRWSSRSKVWYKKGRTDEHMRQAREFARRYNEKGVTD